MSAGAGVAASAPSGPADEVGVSGRRGKTPHQAPRDRASHFAASSGALLFVRYAYPPNELGHCGPPDSAAVRAYGLAGVTGEDPARLARSFAGAWPYLELIADRAGIADPLHHRVVEAYWLGNGLLDGVRLADLGRRLAGAPAADLLGAGRAHHSFHVLCAYPWVGLLPDPRKAGHALSVLNRCLIRWGRVSAVRGDRVVVTSRSLIWDGHRLGLGGPVARPARTSAIGATDLSVGDRVSLHWDLICDRLTDRQVRALRTATRHHLRLVNHRTELSRPGAVSGLARPSAA